MTDVLSDPLKYNLSNKVYLKTTIWITLMNPNQNRNKLKTF